MADYSLSPLGFDFIRKQEGFRAKPYWDVRQWSTGFGTRASGPDDVVDRAEAERRLADEAGKVSAHLSRNVRVPMTQGQHDALVSFGYNLGTDDIDKLMPDINAGNWGRVGQRMLSFNRAGGQVHPVLVARRKAEADMLGGGAGDMPAQRSYLAQAINQAGLIPGVTDMPADAKTPIGGAPDAGGPVPLTAPNMRYSKLADALLASAAGAKPRGWGELLNAAGDLALGYTLGNRADEEQKAYKSKLAEALLGASDNDAMAKTLMATGDDDLVKQGVALKVAQAKPRERRFISTSRGVFDELTQTYVPGTEINPEDKPEKFGTSAQYRLNPETKKLQMGQLSERGGIKWIDAEGDILPGVDKVDTGTEFVFRDKRTNQIIGTQPKDVAGEARDKEVGKGQGERMIAQPATNANMRNSLSGLDRLAKEAQSLRAMEGVEGMTGVFQGSGWVPTVRQSTADAEAKLTTLKSQIAFNVLQAMRDASKTGGALGAVSEKELSLLENNLAGLDPRQSMDAFKAALDRIITYTDEAKGRLGRAYQDTYGRTYEPSPADRTRIDLSAPPQQAAPAAPSPAQTAPVRVNSPEEAMRLAPGTPFITPDGRQKVRP